MQRSLISVISALGLVLSSCNRDTATDEALSSPSASQGGMSLERSATGNTPEAAAATLILESLDQRASYSIGYRMGADLIKDENFDVDRGALLAGLQDGLNQRKQRLDDEAMRIAGNELGERAQVKSAAISASKLDDARAFLEKNGRRAGVETTSSGLQFEMLEGPSDLEAPKPTSFDTVKVHYHGTLMDGRVFDSSIDRGEPVSFTVRGVIPGWAEALQLMAVGEKRRLFVPPALGYGSEGAGSVPPNAVLIFDVELLSIEGKEGGVTE